MRFNRLLGLAAVVLVCSTLHSATIFVAPSGRDAWSGTLQTANRTGTDGPVASLTGARDAVRKLKAAGPLSEPVTIRIAPGAYKLQEPFVLTPEDSGTATAPITYQGVPDRTIFTGGFKITGFKRGADGVWRAQLPEVAAGKRYFEQLWINGYRGVRACTPNMVRLGNTSVPRYFYVKAKHPYGTDANGAPVDLSRRAFRANPEDLAVLQGLSPDQLKDANVVAYHAWEVSRHRIQSVDPATGAVILTGNAPWVFQWLSPNQRYHIENIPAALDAPGEWYLDRNGTLSVIPFEGQNMATATVVASDLDHFVDVKGDAKAGQYVEHVTFRDLDFTYCSYILPPEGHGDGQAAVTVPAAVMVDGARNVTFDACRVQRTGGTYGLWFRSGCRDCKVVKSEFRDLGAGGVKIGESAIRPDPSEQTHACIADNNLITGGGRTFPGAIGVWIGQSSDNQVTHNDISDLFYSGISVGWSWGYRDTIAKRNKIEFNHIHHLGWGVLSDMGAVYTLGISDGTTVSNNVIHDVWSYDKYGWGGLGLYNDEGSTHITMENNLVYDTRDMTYNLHYGKENIVRNNLFVGGRDCQLQYSRIEPHLGFTFENNIVYFKSGDLFRSKALQERKMAFNSNLYWDVSGKPLDFLGFTFEQWQALGQDKDSIVADPKFKDPERHDYTLLPDSPASRIGFKPFDYTKAGLYGDPVWTRKVPTGFAAVEFAPDPPPPPPFVLDEGFEEQPAGSPPVYGTANLEHKGDSIVVTDKVAATGTKSLKFTDVAGLQYSFDPHLVYSMDYQEGTAHCSFDLRLEEGAMLWHEYRDWSVNPYLVGPSLNIVEGKVRVGEKELIVVPLSQWVHYEIEVKLGQPTWQLSVTVPGQQTQRFADLPLASEKWKKLTWIGFVSNATGPSVFYLDNLKIKNDK